MEMLRAMLAAGSLDGPGLPAGRGCLRELAENPALVHHSYPMPSSGASTTSCLASSPLLTECHLAGGKGLPRGSFLLGLGRDVH